MITPVTLGSLCDVHNYVIGMRITWLPKPTLLGRIWRWLTKRNVRLAHINYDLGVLNFEYCR